MKSMQDRIFDYAESIARELAGINEHDSYRAFLKKNMFPTDRRRLGDIDKVVTGVFAKEAADLLETVTNIKHLDLKEVSRNDGRWVHYRKDGHLIFWYAKKEDRLYLRGILHAFLSRYN